MIKYYARTGINFSKHLPVDEISLDSQETLDQIFIAAQYIDDMINDKGLTVFIHSGNGHTRASTIALVYLCLFKKHSLSKNPQELAKVLKSHYSLSQPNMKAVETILKQRSDFQK